MQTKYAPGARPPSATMPLGDTSRYPMPGEMPPKKPQKPTVPPDMMNEMPGYMDMGYTSEMPAKY